MSDSRIRDLMRRAPYSPETLETLMAVLLRSAPLTPCGECGGTGKHEDCDPDYGHNDCPTAPECCVCLGAGVLWNAE